MPASATDGYTALGTSPSLCAQGNILPPSFPDMSFIFSSSLPNFSCSPLPAVIWLLVLGARDSARSLYSCDQPYHLHSPQQVGKGMELLGLAQAD